jgi:chloramphenicol-sensitive protein RarD
MEPKPTSLDSRAGLLYGIAAYGLWGLMPLYFHAITGVPALEVLAHRIVWSVLLLAGLLVLLGRWSEVAACLRVRRTRRLLVASTLLIAANWYAFIWGVETGQVVENSLGYFINPLLNILLGVFFFRERLRGLQWLAIALAGAGLAYLVIALGRPPWLALTLAGSFAAYGLIRKVGGIDTIVALTVETLLLAPAAALALLVWGWQGRLALGTMGTSVDALLLASGVVTAVPLFCFGEAARRLRLSTLGFLQYLAPSLQLITAVLLFGEPFGPERQISFALIWSALVLVWLNTLLVRRPGVAPPEPAAPGTASRWRRRAHRPDDGRPAASATSPPVAGEPGAARL